MQPLTYISLDQLSQLSSGVKLARVIHHKIRSLSNWMIFMAFSRTKNAPDKHQLFPSLAQPSLPYHALNKVYFTTQNMVVVLHIRQMMMMWGQFWLFGSHERSTDKRGANLGSARLSSVQLSPCWLAGCLLCELHHLKTAHMTNFSSPLLMITDLMCPSYFLRAPQAVSRRLHIL